MNQEIKMDKRYRTRDGREVEILKVGVDLGNGDSVVGLLKQNTGTWEYRAWTATGQFLKTMEWSDADLVEVTPQMDDKVMVRDDPRSTWVRRYFAGFTENGRILAWPGGADSWTWKGDMGRTISWNHWRLPTPEELA